MYNGRELTPGPFKDRYFPAAAAGVVPAPADLLRACIGSAYEVQAVLGALLLSEGVPVTLAALVALKREVRGGAAWARDTPAAGAILVSMLLRLAMFGSYGILTERNLELRLPAARARWEWKSD